MMLKKIVIGCCILMVAAGCKSSKQAQKSSADITNKSNADATALWQSKLDQLLVFPSGVNNFYGKAKADFDSPDGGGNATVYIRMLKDSLIWISITGPFNIEGARILITKDSVKIMDKLHQRAEVGSITSAAKYIPLSLSLAELQNFVLGKPIFPSDQQASFSSVQNNVLIKASDNNINYNLQVDSSSFQPVINMLEEKKLTDKRGIVINTGSFVQNGSVLFPQSRKIQVTGSKPATLELSFREYNFKREQSYPFNIPKSYTVRYY